jgi:hypothetical protein
MATKRIVNLPNVSGWIGTAGGAFPAHTVTIDLPVGPRYHEIWIGANPGAAKTLIDNGGTGLFGEFRLKVNGKVQRQALASDINKINVLNGVTYACRGGLTNATAADLCVYLAEPWRENEDAQDGLAWATGDVSTFQLEVDIVNYAGAAAGLTKPTAKAVIDNSLVDAGNGKQVDASMGAIVKWRQVQIPVASGFNDFGGFPKRDFYQSLHFFDYANFSDFEVKVDNNMIRQDSKAGNENRLSAHAMLPAPTATATPATLAADMPTRNMIDIVFDHDDKVSSSLPMRYNGRQVGDFNVRLNTTTTGTIKTIYQLIGPAD